MTQYEIMERVQKVRNRGSYLKWAKLLADFKGCDTEEDRLKAVYKMMDDNNMFGTERVSIWAEESLEQVIKDASRGGQHV